MPLFTLSGTIISMGFILLMNLFAFSYARQFFLHKHESVEVKAETRAASVVKVSKESASQAFFQLEKGNWQTIGVHSDKPIIPELWMLPFVNHYERYESQLLIPEPVIGGFSLRGPPCV